MNTTCSTDTTDVCERVDTPKTITSFVRPRHQAKKTESGYDLRVYVARRRQVRRDSCVRKTMCSPSRPKQAITVPPTWRTLGSELPSRDYRLQVNLNLKIDPERISARVENGVLDIALPLKETSKPRVIEVS